MTALLTLLAMTIMTLKTHGGGIPNWITDDGLKASGVLKKLPKHSRAVTLAKLQFAILET